MRVGVIGTGHVGLVTAGAMVFDLVVMRVLRAEFGAQGDTGVAVNAIHHAWDIVTTRLRWQTWLALLVALVVWAVARYVGVESTKARGSFPTPATVAFLERWGTAVQAVTIALGLLLMLFVPTMTFGLALLIAVVVAGILVLVSWAKGQSTDAPIATGVESQGPTD